MQLTKSGKPRRTADGRPDVTRDRVAAAPDELAALEQDPQNRRAHNDRNVGMIADALRDVGAARSIVIDEDNRILAGNGVATAAGQAGITRVRVVDTDGQEIIAVRRRGLSDAKKRALAIYDNRTAELATWDLEQFGRDRANGLDFAPFFTDDELAGLLSKRNDSPGLTDPDATPAPRRTTIKAGDLFALGEHRLICGDATKAEDVGRLLRDQAPPVLMVTDPPYGVEYDATWRAKAGVNKNKRKMGKVENDDRADWREAWLLFPGAIAYVWHAAMKCAVVQASLEATTFHLRSQIIWAKDRLVLSRGDYHWQHETCWYAIREGTTSKRTTDRTQSTIWEIASTLWRIPARDDGGHGHSTQKPVECMARPIRNHQALTVYDPFVGSGTTIIAAEQLSRRCYAVEFNPVYVQVAIDRWEAFTGRKAEPLERGGRRTKGRHV